MYNSRFHLEDAGLVVNGRHVNLLPGMSVTAEIEIGQRRVIEFLYRHCFVIKRGESG